MNVDLRSNVEPGFAARPGSIPVDQDSWPQEDRESLGVDAAVRCDEVSPVAVVTGTPDRGEGGLSRFAARMVKLAVSLLVAGGDWLSALIARSGGRQPASYCVVLYYHAVRAKDRQRFAAQMDVLASIAVPVDLEGSGDLPAARRYAAVTFDDAFVSVVVNALPALRARGIPSLIFAPTGAIGGRPTWIEAAHHDGSEVVASAELLRSVSDQPLVRIGSHSVSHPNFRRLDDAQARQELADSKAELERITGRQVRSFSFPHGAYTERSLSLARQCGYTQVHTIAPALTRAPREAFVIGRVSVDPGDWPIEFRLKALGAYRWMVWASAFKRRLRDRLHGRRRQVQAVRVA